MRLDLVQPGYRVTSDVHELVKQYAAKLTEQHGFHISANKALAVLIKRGYEEAQNEAERG